MADIHHLVVDRAAQFTQQVVWVDLLDVTAYTTSMKVKDESGSEVISLTGSTYFPAEGNIITISIPASVTANITPGTYYYDMVLSSPTGNRYKLIYGMFILNDTLT